MFNWRECYAAWINLEHRQDRRIKMQSELDRVGLTMERYSAIKTMDYVWDELKFAPILRRTPNACGCYQSQYNVMLEAYNRGVSVWVNEDDLVFSTTVKEQLDYFQNFLNKQDSWAIAWGGGTWHVPAYWHKKGHNEDLQMCNCSLERDAEQTEDSRIMRTYGAFSTHSYFVNIEYLETVLKFLDENIHLCYGIDHCMILLQPFLNCYAMAPGFAKQYNAISDIGMGTVTMFENFSRLNGTLENSAYWWQDRMEYFDPTTFDWKDAVKR